jgi:hypothetical protein
VQHERQPVVGSGQQHVDLPAVRHVDQAPLARQRLAPVIRSPVIRSPVNGSPVIRSPVI